MLEGVCGSAIGPPPGRRPQWSVPNLVDVSGDAGLTSLRAGYLFFCLARVTLEFPARLFGHLDRVQNWTPFCEAFLARFWSPEAPKLSPKSTLFGQVLS